MSEIKQKLKNEVQNLLIPEVELYLNDLHELIEKDEATSDDMEAIRDMESFLVELENILLVVEENKLTEDEAAEVYKKIQKLKEEDNN